MSLMPDFRNPQPIRSDLRTVLRDRILDGSLPPGAAVRSLDVTRKLNVSATPAREAMIELARDGLLQVAPNRGFFVSPISAREIRELYPLMALLEVRALREAPPPQARLPVLNRLNARFSAASNPVTRLALDTEWHELLIADCTNETLRGMLGDLRVRIRRYELAYLRDAQRAPKSASQHQAILRSLREGDLSGAARLLEQNWTQGVDLIAPWAERQERKA